MKQTIYSQVSIDTIDSRIHPTTNKNAPYQLEVYHTKEQPNKNIGVLNTNTNQYSYNIGDVVDVKPEISVSPTLLLQNIIMNKFLENFLRTK